ncbi:phage regulatory protein, rha family [Faunimonas pinastri]|uniref:Phage regulatory protein, rha family n=1 Tax=Faunimonas pinastri TaxID=1855383 RepID=A0A1H9QB67_9HYPH|nr:phage regulatory protein/antirepressor Ant [Faunimonas pinastri]SER57415.1 phage regulatory protein, rha family [Faunimonas pinastri]
MEASTENVGGALVPADQRQAESQPVVFYQDGTARTNSREVARVFEKNHRDVLRAVGNLLQQEPDLGLRSFTQTPFIEASTGQTYRSFDMDRDGFTLLAMGFTGAKALKWKLRYIETFNTMEAELRRGSQDVAALLNDPATLRRALADYSERVITLEGQVEQLAPKAEGFDRIASTSGSLTVTAAAKTLQVGPKELFTWLRAHSWIYRSGDGRELAYQTKLQAGLLEHKLARVPRENGDLLTVTQVRVTPKGLAKLSELIVDRPAQH